MFQFLNVREIFVVYYASIFIRRFNNVSSININSCTAPVVTVFKRNTFRIILANFVAVFYCLVCMISLGDIYRLIHVSDPFSVSFRTCANCRVYLSKNEKIRKILCKLLISIIILFCLFTFLYKNNVLPPHKTAIIALINSASNSSQSDA